MIGGARIASGYLAMTEGGRNDIQGVRGCEGGGGWCMMGVSTGMGFPGRFFLF